MSSFLSPFRLIEAVRTRRRESVQQKECIRRQKAHDRLSRPQNGIVVTTLINTGTQPVHVAETFIGRHSLPKRQ